MVRLKANNIKINYGDRTIVQDLSIELPDKEITVILGPNGCGKSTLLKALTRIIPHQAGTVTLDGEAIAKESTKDLAKKMAVLPQTPESAGALTVGELVSYGRFPHQKALGRLSERDLEIIDWALEVTGTTFFRSHPVDSLSGGQRQRVWIAMALAQDTEIIFLDEPTTYLDMAHQLEIMELLQKLNREQGRTIIMVLHDLNHAARFADYLIGMKFGKVLHTGTSEEMMTKGVLKDLFHIDAEIGIDPRTGKPICTTYNLIKELVK